MASRLRAPRSVLWIFVLAAGLAPAAAADQDGDGVADADDNCLVHANADQRDTNLDGYGNACDADYNDSGLVNMVDRSFFNQALGSQAGDPDYDEDADHDGDGDVDGDDQATFNSLFGSAPGPSGLACAGQQPCFSPNTDLDGDGVPNGDDNCLVHANADQRDTNLDGYGNACDADYNDSGLVNMVDRAIFNQARGSQVPQAAYNEDADHDGDGDVDGDDEAVFNSFFGSAPGPSGLACAGEQSCFSPDTDLDGDGVPNGEDNCIQHPNEGQQDTDSDGFGNRCDGDFDNTGFVDEADLATFNCIFGRAEPLNYYSTQDEADLDSNGIVNVFDRWIFNTLVGEPPGPSGLAETGPFDGADPFGDDDGDGWPLYQDTYSELSDPDNRDTDHDGFGNRCDADYDNNGQVTIFDRVVFLQAYGSQAGDEEYSRHSDHDGDGDVDDDDLATFNALFGSPPGPTGLACAPGNAAPTCSDSSFEMANNGPTHSGTVTGSDSSDPITFGVEREPTRGTLSLDPGTGAFDYTPSPESSGGLDHFVFSANDDNGASASCRVSIVQRPVTCPGCCPGVDLNENQILEPGEHNCFAVFVMPDTQNYMTDPANNDDPDGNGFPPFPEYRARWLERIAEWVCTARGHWDDPHSNVEMRVEMLLQLGDIVNGNEWTPNPNPNYAGDDCTLNRCEWERADRVFDVLDACEVPYLAVPGNHDWKGPNSAGAPAATFDTMLYDEFFGETDGSGGPNLHGRAFSDARCGTGEAAPISPLCDGVTSWYLGGGGAETPESSDPPGNLIEAMSRSVGSSTGPTVDHPGRHRAGFVRAPDGSPYLFVGTEFTPGLPFSVAWPEELIAANPAVPTLLFNHEGVPFGSPEWDALVAAQPNVYLVLNGHTANGSTESTVTRADGSEYVVPKVTRDYQWFGGGDGWNAILVIDPDKGEFRLRSYRLKGEEVGGDMEPVDLVGEDLPEAPFLVYPLRPGLMP